MQTASLIFGILAIIGMVIGFIPCFGSLNWINIPFSAIGAIFCVVAMNKKEVNPDGTPNKNATIGLVLCVVAMFFGLIRLLLGGGIL
ncbi:hypothetical protein NLM59_01875 [Weeksellaceae bacterium KMM 9724]|uniref:hypothetical protein n=1 Tax=Profundicola chukchiensis TaxID=2961959 RepID=UPI00244047C7|nr:hypothetical protein [Profundicola chukchiensis]MDG4949660.1 hypothetical protein [Profundicola chukchiensis]